MQSIQLYYKEGASDKIYQASLEPYDGAWIVCFAFGRRGTLITAKIAKGYTPGESGTPYQADRVIPECTLNS